MQVPPEDPVTHEDVIENRRTHANYSRYYKSKMFQNNCKDCLLRAVDPDALKVRNTRGELHGGAPHA